MKFGAGRLTAADRIPVGASRERGVRGPVLRVRAPPGKPRAKASDPRVTGATLPHALVRTMTGVSPSWGEARTGSAGSGPSKVAVTTDRGGPRPGFQTGFGETR